MDFYCKICQKDLKREDLLEYCRCPACGRFATYGDQLNASLKEMLRMKIMSDKTIGSDELIRLKMGRVL